MAFPHSIIHGSSTVSDWRNRTEGPPDTPVNAAALETIDQALYDVGQQVLALKPLFPSGGSDVAAIAAKLPKAELDVGSFQVNSGLVVANPSLIRGKGPAEPQDWTKYLTELVTNSATVSAITYNGTAGIIERMSMRCTASPPTAGAAIEIPIAANKGNNTKIRDMTIKGFYNGIMLAGTQAKISDTIVEDAVNAAYVIDMFNPDEGDQRLSDCYAHARNRDCTYGFQFKGGGGLHARGLKTNGTVPTHHFDTALDFNLSAAAGTGEILVSDSVLDMFTNKGVNIAADAGEVLGGFFFDQVYIKDAGGGDYGYYIDGGAGSGIDEVRIQGGGIRLPADAIAAVYVHQVVEFHFSDCPIIGVTPGNALIRLGNVVSASVKMDQTAPASNTVAFTPGTTTKLIESVNVGSINAYRYGNGRIDGDFTWQLPSITSTSTWVDIWEIDTSGYGGAKVEVIISGAISGGAGGFVFNATRLIAGTAGGLDGINAILTDEAQPIDQIEVQWVSPAANKVRIQVRKKAGSSVATPIDGTSRLKVDGVIQAITAFN